MTIVPKTIKNQNELIESIVLVLPNLSTIETLRQAYIQQNPDIKIDPLFGTMSWNTTGDSIDKLAYADSLEILSKNQDLTVIYESKEKNKEEWYGLNGGFLFLGLFLGMLFTIGTVLITYFKQVSEGYDDREKFQIMQKVGLDQKMIKDSTRIQIIWMFFLPILLSIIHIAFAYPIIQKILVIFGISDKKLLIISILSVVVAFSLIYYLIYRITSKIYYTIVK